MLYVTRCHISMHAYALSHGIYAETYLEQHPEVLVTYRETQKPII